MAGCDVGTYISACRNFDVYEASASFPCRSPMRFCVQCVTGLRAPKVVWMNSWNESQVTFLPAASSTVAKARYSS